MHDYVYDQSALYKHACNTHYLLSNVFIVSPTAAGMFKLKNRCYSFHLTQYIRLI